MTKRLFSLAVMMCLATIGAWADVTSIDSQTLWTFDGYSGQTVKVFNQDGMYLHAAGSFDSFTADSQNMSATSGTFSGTSVEWNTEKKLVAGTGVDSNFLSLGNIDAASEDGADASLAFNHSGSGRLYIVYEAASASDGTFYVQQRKSGETEYTTLYNETMPGRSYTGPLGAPKATNDISTSLQEAIVTLNGAGSVYFGADQPYCIYAVLFVPTYLDNPAYGTYDFQTWAEANISANSQVAIGLTADGIMTGAFTPPTTDGVTMNGTMTLNGVFGINNATAYKLRKNGSTGNSSSGLMISKTGGAKLTINRLQAGDWFTIATDVESRLQFASDNANVHAAGSAETITQNSYVQSGTIYLVTAATTVDVYSKDVGTVYIHRVQISDEDAVAAPIITVDANNLVTIDGGTSLKGNAVTVYYTTDNTDPKTSATRQVYTGPFTPTETSKIRAYSYVTDDETLISEEAEPKAVRFGTWTGEVNVFDFASAANNYVDITFEDNKLDDIRMYGGGNSPDATANFYPITNTDWLTASEGNTATVAWREKGAKFDNGGLTPNGQTYFTIANLTEGQRVVIEYYGRLRYRTNVSDTAPVVLNESGETITTDTYFGTAAQDNTTTFTIKSGSYMVFLCATNDVVIKNITVLAPVQKFTLNTSVNVEDRGTIAVNPEGTEFDEDTEITLTATPNSGYVFTKWTDGEDNELSTDNPYTFNITANTTVKAVFEAKPTNLGKTIPVILVAGQSNTDGRVPASDLPSIETEYTGLQNCYWSYCNAQKVYAGSGLSTSYTDEGNFQLYSPLNDGGGGWAYDAVVYNEIGKYLKENYNENFYVIKQSKGNTGISPAAGGCGLFWSANPLWLSRNTSVNEGGQSLLKGLMGNIEASLAKIAEEHPEKDADIKFLMWHQGECDGAGSQGVAYYTQMKAIINYVRNYLAQKNAKYSNLPIILGGIPTVSDQYNESVEAAKQQLADEDMNVYYVAADMVTDKATDLIQESTTVHFNAKSAKAFGAAVWQTISDNHLLDGLMDGTGSAEPVDEILAETVVAETTKWNFSEKAVNTVYSTNTDNEGLYLIASDSKKMTVKEMSGVTSVSYRDGETVTTSQALYTEAANRSAWTKYGLTAGDISGVDRSFGVNVSEAGTFYAIVAPNTQPSEAQTGRTMYLVVNGVKVDEVNALDAWNNENHLAELKYKMTEPGTIYLMSDHAYNLYAAKFVKASEETGAFQVKVTADGGTVTLTSPAGKTLDDYFDKGTEVTLQATPDNEKFSFVKWTGDVPEEADATSNILTLTLDADKELTAVFQHAETFDFTELYNNDNTFDLAISETKSTVYYYKRTDDTTGEDASGNFYALTAAPINSTISWREKNVELTANGLKPTKGDRPFVIHGLKAGDAVSIEFVGDIYYAKHSSKGSALDGLTAGQYITTRTAYTVSEQDATNDYVVFYPTTNTFISRIAINQELVEKAEVVSAPAITLRSNYTNRVTITSGVSSKGNAVTTYYTTDGNDPTTESDSFTESYKNFGPYTSNMTFKAMTVSETGIQSEISTFNLILPVFTITLPEDQEGGTVTADRTEATEGVTVRLTVTPAEGYYLAQLTAEGGAEITETNTFRMPASDVIISALFKQEDGHSSETVRENITIIDYDNARLTSIVAGENATTLTVSGDVFSVPVTSISNTAFTEENTSHLAVIDLSETAVTISGNRSELNALKNIHSEALIYMPATASVTGTNVVSKTDTGFTCDDYQLTDGGLCAVPYDFTATTATMNREFVANKKCTVCLPFNFTATGGTFYKFTGINNGKVQMTAQEPNSMLEANTPYIFEPNEGTEAIVSENVEVSISDTPQTDNEEAKFSFIGTYEPIVWDHPSGIYGYAAEQQGLTEVGQFVRVGSGASISACRAYLQYTGEGTISESRGYQSMKKLPERYDILWIPYGSTTSINVVEQSSNDDDHVPAYNLNGQKVSNSYKGIVIKNGKTMIRK